MAPSVDLPPSGYSEGVRSQSSPNIRSRENLEVASLQSSNGDEVCCDIIKDVMLIAIPAILIVGVAVAALYSWPALVVISAVVLGGVVGSSIVWLVGVVVSCILESCYPIESTGPRFPFSHSSLSQQVFQPISQEDFVAYGESFKVWFEEKRRNPPEPVMVDGFYCLNLGFEEKTKSSLANDITPNNLKKVEISYNGELLVQNVERSTSGSIRDQDVVFAQFCDALKAKLPAEFRGEAERMLLSACGKLPFGLILANILGQGIIGPKEATVISRTINATPEKPFKKITFRATEDSVTITVRIGLQIILKHLQSGSNREPTSQFNDISIGDVYPVVEFTYRKGDTDQGEPLIVKSIEERVEFE